MPAGAVEGLCARERSELHMAEEELTLSCPRCGQAFKSAIQMDSATWAAIRMDLGLIERCPHCGWSSPFSKSDYFFEPSVTEF
jgi:predicted RNA-binding Zn-ribbon protein involved in translation (DUF1610 family)